MSNVSVNSLHPEDYANLLAKACKMKPYPDTQQFKNCEIIQGSMKYMDYLADCPKQATAVSCLPRDHLKTGGRGLPTNKKGSTMYDLDFEDNNMDSTKLTHLANRTSTVYHVKEAALRKQYGLDDDAPPMTAKELIERITNGKYVVPTDRMDTRVYDSTRYFTWRDPAVKADQDGYNKAVVALKAAKTAAEDVIVIMDDPATRLKALQEFEAVTIH